MLLLNKSKPEWSEHHQEMLEKSLEKLMDTEKFNTLLSRMNTSEKVPQQEKLTSRSVCYSDNPRLLDCKYRNPEQIETYQSDVLYPKLVELACSNTAIATGIVRRASDVSDDSYHISGLAAALVKSLNSPNSCPGIAALPEKTRQNLLIKSQSIQK